MDKENVNKVKSSKNIIEQVLKIPTELTHRTKTKNDLNKRKFDELILALENIEGRSMLLVEEFNLDLSKYEELYYVAINNLLDLLYPVDVVNLIKFYLYGRLTPDGAIVPILDSENNEIILENTTDLYNIVQHMLNIKK